MTTTDNGNNGNGNDETTQGSSSSMVACVLLETSLGDIVLDLDGDSSPEAVRNFIKLCKVGYYSATLVHTVLAGRFAVCGDPTGTGQGGASIHALLQDYQDHPPKNYNINNKTNSKGSNNDNDSNNDDEDARAREARLGKSACRFLKQAAGRPLTAIERREKGRVAAVQLPGIPDTVGSQFLITTAGGPDAGLDGYHQQQQQQQQQQQHYPSLGIVAEDTAGVLNRLDAIPCDGQGRPLADIRIRRALVVHDPFPDPPGMEDVLLTMTTKTTTTRKRSCCSPSPERPLQEVVPARVPVEDLEENKDDDSLDNEDDEQEISPEELKRRQHRAWQVAQTSARQEDRGRAVVLEMLGDLPSAEATAPEHVLFICKLNSVTTDEDLELIFGRFDPAVTVDVVRDQDTGQSLQYAFATFTDKTKAARAYFKMDNALIDDRRIKVDFSQSVAHVWDRYHQRMRGGRSGSGAAKGGGGGRGSMPRLGEISGPGAQSRGGGGGGAQRHGGDGRGRDTESSLHHRHENHDRQHNDGRPHHAAPKGRSDQHEQSDRRGHRREDDRHKASRKRSVDDEAGRHERDRSSPADRRDQHRRRHGYHERRHSPNSDIDDRGQSRHRKDHRQHRDLRHRDHPESDGRLRDEDGEERKHRRRDNDRRREGGGERSQFREGNGKDYQDREQQVGDERRRRRRSHSSDRRSRSIDNENADSRRGGHRYHRRNERGDHVDREERSRSKRRRARDHGSEESEDEDSSDKERRQKRHKERRRSDDRERDREHGHSKTRHH